MYMVNLSVFFFAETKIVLLNKLQSNFQSADFTKSCVIKSRVNMVRAMELQVSFGALFIGESYFFLEPFFL